MKRAQHNRLSENGNALWFILVAIVLLGALTILLSRSGSSVNQSGDVEQMRIKASNVLRYAKGIESAIEQMKLNGISENEISFQNPTTATNYTNGSCDTAADQHFPECKIFDVGGAGQTYLAPPPGSNDGSEWIFTGANNVAGAGTSAALTGNDLVMLLPNADTALCLQINRDLDVDSSGEIPVDADAAALGAFTGTFANTLTVLDGNGSAPLELDGHGAGCFTDSSVGNVTYFYYVLLAR